MESRLDVVDLGLMPYAEALAEQRRVHEGVVRGDEATVLLVEHPPTVTVSQRRGVTQNLLASRYQLQRLGVEVQETDRGGDITLHLPGQLVAYPILPLNALGLNVGRYMRLLETAVIRAVGGFGVEAERVEGCTGVWIPPPPHAEGPDASLAELRSASAREPSPQPSPGGAGGQLPQAAKLCALGVRVKRGVSMHGLALNVSPDLSLFELIVPCGLANRRVTSLRERLAERCPQMGEVKRAVVSSLSEALRE